MAECECLEKCPFFHDKMGKAPALGDMMKKKYCLEDATDCARHMVFKAKGKGNVPGNLFPNQLDKAKQLINA